MPLLLYASFKVVAAVCSWNQRLKFKKKKKLLEMFNFPFRIEEIYEHTVNTSITHVCKSADTPLTSSFVS